MRVTLKKTTAEVPSVDVELTVSEVTTNQVESPSDTDIKTKNSPEPIVRSNNLPLTILSKVAELQADLAASEINKNNYHYYKINIELLKLIVGLSESLKASQPTKTVFKVSRAKGVTRSQD